MEGYMGNVVYSIRHKDSLNYELSDFTCYVENLDEFERLWLREERDIEAIADYYKSKLTLNKKKRSDDEILKKHDYEIVSSELFYYYDKTLNFADEGENDFLVHFEGLEIEIRVIRVDDAYKLVYDYWGKGVSVINTLDKDRKHSYEPLKYRGNSVIWCNMPEIDWRFAEKSKKYDKYTMKRKFFEHSSVGSFVWLVLNDKVSKDYKIASPDDAALVSMMADVKGAPVQ